MFQSVAISCVLLMTSSAISQRRLNYLLQSKVVRVHVERPVTPKDSSVEVYSCKHYILDVNKIKYKFS